MQDYLTGTAVQSRQKSGVKPIVWIVIVAIIILIIWLLAHRSSRLLIEEGREYTIFSFKSSLAPANVGGKEQRVDAYLVTFLYPNGKGPEMRRETILVPKFGITRDLDLPENTMVWNKPTELEGRTYQFMRWNPRTMLPSTDKPLIRPEKPAQVRE